MLGGRRGDLDAGIQVETSADGQWGPNLLSDGPFLVHCHGGAGADVWHAGYSGPALSFRSGAKPSREV